MPRFWVTYDQDGNPTEFTKMEAQHCPAQEGTEVSEFEYNEARHKANQLKAERLKKREEKRLNVNPDEAIDKFFRRNSPERSALEWVRQKLNIDEKTAKLELKQIHRNRRGQ